MTLTTEQRTHVLALLATMTDAQVMGLSITLCDGCEIGDCTTPAEVEGVEFVLALHAVVADHTIDPDTAA